MYSRYQFTEEQSDEKIRKIIQEVQDKFGI